MTPNDNRSSTSTTAATTLNDFRVRGFAADDGGRTSTLLSVMASVVAAAGLGVAAYVFLAPDKTPDVPVSAATSGVGTVPAPAAPTMATAPEPALPQMTPPLASPATAPAPSASAKSGGQKQDLRASASKQTPKKSAQAATERSAPRQATKSSASESVVIDQTAQAPSPVVVPREPVATGPSDSAAPSSN